MEQTIVNLPEIQEVALKGVRRTAVFMGLGINAAMDTKFKNYELTQLVQIQLIPPDVDETTLAEFKTEFARWIVACGLRELIETFSVFLDKLNLACLRIKISSKQIPLDSLEALDRKFRERGLDDKFAYLRDQYRVTTKNQDYLMSIHKARNCLTHRRGIVSNKDCPNGTELAVKWLSHDLYAKTPTGDTISLQPIPEGGTFVPAGSDVMLKQNVERIRVFPLNDLVTFSPRDLAEICAFVLAVTTEMIQSAQTYGTNNGIQWTYKDGSSDNLEENRE